MDEQHPDRQLEVDAREARILGANATMYWGFDDLGGSSAEGHAADARRRRFQRYAKSLIVKLDADPGRLAAISEILPEQAVRNGKGRRHRGAYNALILTEVAQGMLSEAGADTNIEARERLIQDLTAARMVTVDVVSATRVAHKASRRALRRLSPLWWLRRLDARFLVRMGHRRHEPGAAGLQEIRMLRGEYEIGTLQYQICDDCRLGCVEKISIDDSYQGRGIGTRALMLIRANVPGYEWCTSGQYDTAKSFWQRIAHRTGDAYTDDEGGLHPCTHME